MSLSRIFAGLVLGALVLGESLAAPVTYTFSTSPLQVSTVLLPTTSTFNLNPLHVITSEERAVTQSLNALLAGTIVTGTFVYDPAIPRTSMTTSGSLGNRGANYVGSFTNLSAALVGGSLLTADRRITDPRGQTVVGDEAFICSTCLIPDDFLQLQAEPGNGLNPSLLNIGDTLGLTLGLEAYEVFNFRMLWLQRLAVPELIDDFLNSNSLPNPLPTINGRLGLDIVKSSNPFGTQSIMFYDNLRVAAVPEPVPLALIGIGLAGLGFRRRKLERG
jgi:hypothetical protein